MKIIITLQTIPRIVINSLKRKIKKKRTEVRFFLYIVCNQFINRVLDESFHNVDPNNKR